MQSHTAEHRTNTELTIELNSQMLKHYQQRAHFERSVVFHQLLKRLKKLIF